MLFSVDGILYRVGTWLYRLVLLNVLFCLCSIPIVTIPASLAALYALVRKHVNNEEPPIFFTFLLAFKENFKRATLAGIPFFVFLIVWRWDLGLLEQSHSMFAGVASTALILLLVVLTSTWMHVFPFMVHLECSIKQLLSNAFKFTMIKPFLTLVMLFWLALVLYLSALMPLLLIVCSFSVFATITYRLVNKKLEFVDVIQSTRR